MRESVCSRWDGKVACGDVCLRHVRLRRAKHAQQAERLKSLHRASHESQMASATQPSSSPIERMVSPRLFRAAIIQKPYPILMPVSLAQCQSRPLGLRQLVSDVLNHDSACPMAVKIFTIGGKVGSCYLQHISS